MYFRLETSRIWKRYPSVLKTRGVHEEMSGYRRKGYPVFTMVWNERLAKEKERQSDRQADRYSRVEKDRQNLDIWLIFILMRLMEYLEENKPL